MVYYDIMVSSERHVFQFAETVICFKFAFGLIEGCTILSSGVTGGGREGGFHREIFVDLPRKQRQKKMENGEEKKKNCEREGGKLKMEVEEVWKWGEDLFFLSFFLLLLLLLLSLFEITKIWGIPKWKIFYRRKSIFHAENKLGKVTLPPLKNIPVTPLIVT